MSRTDMRIAMSDTHECELQHRGLNASTPEGTIQWTDKMPTMPGWYWLQRAILRHNADAWHEVHPVLVEVTEDTNGTFGLYMPGLDHVWRTRHRESFPHSVPYSARPADSLAANPHVAYRLIAARIMANGRSMMSWSWNGPDRYVRLLSVVGDEGQANGAQLLAGSY